MPFKIEQILKPTLRQKELMSLKDKARKIDDCLIACLNFEKKLDQYQGM